MKWFNQKAEIERLEGQVKRLKSNLEDANNSLEFWKKSTWKDLEEIEKLNNQISLSNDWKASALKALAKNSALKAENSALKNGIQECIDYETLKANATVRRITNKLRGLL